MKKNIFLLLLLGAMASPAIAQTIDTVQWKTPIYHYSTWYDSCSDFYNTDPILGFGVPAMKTEKISSLYQIEEEYRTCLPNYVERPTQILGIAVTEPVDWNEVNLRPSLVRNWYHLPEYAYLYQKEGENSYKLIDSVRWDTVPKKILKVALNADTARFPHKLLYVYEAYFKDPQTVDSLFYLRVSNNGVIRAGNTGMYFAYNYLPTMPIGIINHTFPRLPGICTLPPWYKVYLFNLLDETWEPYGEYSHPIMASPIYGALFPIVDYVELSVISHDADMGTAGPVAKVSRGMSHTITATPKPRHRFVQWNDGVTDNPRTVYITQDTSFTAYFVEDSTEVSVVAESDLWPLGFVEGDGTYFVADTVTLHAKVSQIMPANMQVRFSHWNDGVTVNPRQFIVTKDTAFTAYFAVDTTHGSGDTTAINPVGDAQPGLFTLTPNPTTGEVQVIVKSEKLKDKSCTVTVLDASGHEVLRTTLNSQLLTLNLQSLPTGTYFVTVTADTKADGDIRVPSVTATKKLILK